MEIFVAPAPRGLEAVHHHLFTQDTKTFVAKLVRAYKVKVKQLYLERRRRVLEVKNDNWHPPSLDFNFGSSSWTVEKVPPCLLDRRLDLGDVSPSNLSHFSRALNADVQGIQVDFDDGHCPTWKAQIEGHHNVKLAVHNQMPKVPRIQDAPVIMFRPRAWNMTEHNMIVDGEAVPGPLFDFGLHIALNGRKLFDVGRGPFFYLSKVESAKEAELWDDIFCWAELQLSIPIGTIKASVLIEDILAAFEMDSILSALRRHSAGLNCGIWDYCASIVARFGHRSSFLLPDRNKYVNMEKTFLKKYMALAVQVCQKRGTVATGGMAAIMADSKEVKKKVVDAKRKEIQAGVAGFMVYDVRLVPEIKKLWGEFNNQRVAVGLCESITSQDLLTIPCGGVTRQGLEHNVRVALLFIHHWLEEGTGHFILKGAVEDSATAEISRWQVRQWIQHKAKIEDTDSTVTHGLVVNIVSSAMSEFKLAPTVVALYLRLLTLQPVPQFITTFLSDFFILDSSPCTYLHPMSNL